MTSQNGTSNSIQPISLHPENNRYFLFRGKPTVLITSAEHYGALLNGKFDYLTYLDELSAHGLNHTRIFSGAYSEVEGSFNIENNTLMVAHENYVCPWSRSEVQGAGDGGNKFDLDNWNGDYFNRLKDLCQEASNRGIVIEFTFFCPFYGGRQWDICPLNDKNNTNDVEQVVSSKEVFMLENSSLLKYEDALVRKIVKELNEFDNIILEICNEPYADDIGVEWEHHIAETIADLEKQLPYQHLISQNVSNGYTVIEQPNPNVSLFNFHYASPPEAVKVNNHLGKPIGLNETGFAGTRDFTYRYQAWEFLLAGGALYNNLDYSFAVGYEKGNYEYGPDSPGGGSRSLRQQLGILVEFIESFDFVHMAPSHSIIKKSTLMNGPGYLMANEGKEYAMYLRGNGQIVLSLDIPAGQYQVEWLDPKTGENVKNEEVHHAGGYLRISCSGWKEDIALKMIHIENE